MTGSYYKRRPVLELTWDQVLSWFYREVREPMVLLDLPDLL